jgi:hypothetical protein
MKSLIGLFYYTFFLSAHESVYGFHTTLLPTLSGNTPSFYSSVSNDEFDSSNRDEVTSLIMDLSKETNDEIRREKLSSLLKERLNQEDSVEAAKFALLWDKIVIEIGSKVQEEARAKAEESAISQSGEKNVNSDPEVTSDHNDSTGVKSGEELKLWAMIDMMIQSKHIIKNAMDGKLR